MRSATTRTTTSGLYSGSEHTKKHNIHRQISSTQLNRVKSAQIIKPSMNRKYKTEPITSLIPTQLQQRYINESFMFQNHEYMLSLLKLVPQDVINHLNFNHFGVQGLDKFIADESMVFRMYETLGKLDKEIIQNLFSEEEQIFQDEIGIATQKQKSILDNFRLDTFPKIIELLDDFVATVIAKQKDGNIATFMEQLWKFFVVILDLNAQWQQKRYDLLLQQATSLLRTQLDELKISYNVLHQKYIQGMKGNQLRIAVEQKKNHHLKEENILIKQDYEELLEKIVELNNIEKASGDLQLINRHQKEMEVTLLNFNRSFIENSKEATTSIQRIAALFKQNHEQNKSFIQRGMESFHFEYKQQELISINPIVGIHEEIHEHKQQNNNDAKDFLYFVIQNIQQYPQTSGPELFYFWADQSKQKWQLLSQHSDDDYTQIARLIIGLGQRPLSYRCIYEAVKLFRQLTLENTQSVGNKRKSLSLNEEPSINLGSLDEIINLQQQQEILGEKLYSYLREESNNQTLISILLNAMQFYSIEEHDQWNESCSQWMKYIENSRWVEYAQFYNIDNILLFQFINLKYKNSKKDTQSLQETFDMAYQIWLFKPRVFIKPQSLDSQHKTPGQIKQKGRLFMKQATLPEDRRKK
ncbi:hypothetical protein pb186bvf_016326 [Paramecium bursaria]